MNKRIKWISTVPPTLLLALGLATNLAYATGIKGADEGGLSTIRISIRIPIEEVETADPAALSSAKTPMREAQASSAPGTPTRDLGQVHTVTGQATSGGQPVAGVRFNFVVTGANSASGSCVTGGSGTCSFSYTGTAPGLDTITLTAIFNGQSVGSATSFVTWIARDFGDAPEPPYPTLRAADGARHGVGALKLGPTVDFEIDGQPNSTASGDDLAGTDDEDGVQFSSLLAGEAATVDVAVSAGPAMLDAWVDFDQDGSWDDPGERIFDHYTVQDGANDGLVFQVPNTAQHGASFARIRLSSAGVGGPTGAAWDGEVEDEQVSINAATLSVSDASVSEGDSGTSSLSFTVSLSNASADPVFVDYVTTDGTATLADADYLAASGTLEFTPGQTSRTVAVSLNGDMKFELDETLSLTLSSPVGASLSDGTRRNAAMDRRRDCPARWERASVMARPPARSSTTMPSPRWLLARPVER